MMSIRKWARGTLVALAMAWSCSVNLAAQVGDESTSAAVDELLFEGPALFPVLVEPPPDFDPAQSYPAVVALHGFGGSTESFRRVAPAFTKAGFVVIFPEAPYSYAEEGESRSRYSWGLNTWTPLPLTDDPEVDIGTSRLTVKEYLPAAIERVRERYELDGLYYFGFSQGAVYAFSAGLLHHEEVGGIIVFGLDGPSREWEPILGVALEQANHLPVLFGLGRSDRMVRFGNAQRHRDLLKEAGYDVTFQAFDGGHSVPQEELAKAAQWLRSVHESRSRQTGAVPIEVVSRGEVMQGRFFRFQARGPRPTLLLVPGFPGDPRDVLGLGGMLHELGIHVVTFNPRGLQGSEGTMTFLGTLDDIGAAYDWLHQEEIVERFDIDTSAIFLGGHSFGGGVAMAYAARDPRVRAVISIAGTDHGVFIRKFHGEADFAAEIRELLQSMRTPAGSARFEVEATLEELAEHQDALGLQENAAHLADRAVLLIGGWQDRNTAVEEHMLPLYRALRAAGGEDITPIVYQDDHGFRKVRRRLAEDLAKWVREMAGR